MEYPAATCSTVLEAPRSRRAAGGKVAYLMSRFPKLTETFVLYEMLAVEQEGLAVEVYPLQRERTAVVHPEAVAMVRRAHFCPFFSWSILCAQLHFLRHRPAAYLGALWTLLRATWGSARYFFGALVFFPKIVYFARSMAAEGVTHVHAHFASHPAAAAFVIRRLTGIPYSFTVHGSDLYRDRHMIHEKVEEAEFVVAISNHIRELIVAECGEQMRPKVHVVHCGVDTEVFQPAGDGGPDQEKGSGPFTILLIGTFHEVKGQTHLVEACRRLRQRGRDFRCWFVGDGPDQRMLARQVARAGLEDRVRFWGRLARHEVADLLRRADVLVTPSVPSRDGRREGIPVVLMEAMASGVPVVASDLSGIPELVEHEVSGLLVPPGDAEGLADALEQLLDSAPLRARLAQAGREKVVGQFDLARNANVLARRFAGGGKP